MSFIEFKNIENYYGQDLSFVKEIFFSLGGVIVGFGLSEFANFMKNRRIRNNIGLSFQNEIDAIKPALITQVKLNKTYIDDIRLFKLRYPTLTINKNLDFVKNLDRLKVTEYNKSKYGDNALQKIRTIYNQLIVIEINIESFKSLNHDFSMELTKLYAMYRENGNKFSRYLIHYYTSNNLSVGSDILIDKVGELITENLLKNKNTTDIMQFESSVHKPLIELLFQQHSHPIYDKAIEFHHVGTDILTNLKIAILSYTNQIELINTSLEKSYEKMYEEKIPEEKNDLYGSN